MNQTPFHPDFRAPQPQPAPQPLTYRPAAQAFTRAPRPRRAAVAGFVATVLLSAGAGGAMGVAASQLAGGQPAYQSTTHVASTVVQADPSNPDWTATAKAAAGSVVAIQVSGPQGSGEGSGVVIDPDGTIVSNNHVVSMAGSGGQLNVVIGEHVHEAKVVGTDPSTDLAVIRLVDPPKDLVAIQFADPGEVVVGQPVMAIGNPLGLSDTVTTGIVSALNRPVTTSAVGSDGADSSNGLVVTAAIQTSAAINPGNSGGALVDASGRLIGITSSIATLSQGGQGQSGNIGIGFAIPMNQVRNVVEQLVATGRAQHPQLGIGARNNDGSQLGALVTEVTPGSGAARAGIRQGDVITGIDGAPVTSSEQLIGLVRAQRVGQEVVLQVVRDATTTEVRATLGSTSQ